MLTLETERLLLRDFRPDDLPAYRALRDEAAFQRFYPEANAAPNQAAHLLGLFVAGAAQRPRAMYQLAVVLPPKRLIGSCGLRLAAAGAQDASFGCELASACWGQGYAYEASHALIDFGFTTLGLHRIYAETISENEAALALARRLGFHIEEERRNDQRFKGRWWTTTRLAIRASAWS